MGQSFLRKALLALTLGSLLHFILEPIPVFGDLIAGLVAGYIADKKPGFAAGIGFLAGILADTLIGLTLVLFYAALSPYLSFLAESLKNLILTFSLALPILYGLKGAFISLLGGFIGYYISSFSKAGTSESKSF